MRIFVCDGWQKFWQEGQAWWQARGHEVTRSVHWGPKFVEGRDLVIFHPTDNNLIQASRRQEKPPGTFVLAEAVDVDIYANHPGAVNWEFVDALVFYAEHMREFAEARFKFPDGLPRYVVPGGVDLGRWTLRSGPRGYNVAWIGRLWIAKNVFGALQVFNQLIKTDPDAPWRLFLRGEKWHPPTWWRRHCEAYLEANAALAERVELVEKHIPDLNAWLDDKDFLLQTSYKESFGYVIAQAAAKGIRPVIQQTLGATDIWPREWVFDTHDEAVGMLLMDYDREQVRGVVAERYPLELRMRRIESITGLDFMV